MWNSHMPSGFLIGRLILGFNLVLILINLSYAHPALKNVTIIAPDGTNDQGDPHLLCIPTKWSDILVFFLGNLVATVKTLPGEPTLHLLFYQIFALLFPTSGVIRGLNAIYQRAIFSK